MSAIPEALLDETAEDLYENAPCGYLTTTVDGVIARVNKTFEVLTGHRRERLIGAVRFQELLSRSGQIYFETHCAPLLRMQGSASEIALELVRADGSTLTALINSVLHSDDAGGPESIRTAIFDATDRRRYEHELLAGRDREREIARRLQSVMLPADLPADAAVELAVEYRPGERALAVGGDWYDAFWLEEGRRMLLVVGDVVGRGLDAAADMGQLRSATRTLARRTAGPAALIDELDELAGVHGFGRWSTAVCVELEMKGRSFRYACAGHPPPILGWPGKAPEILWGGRSGPIGTQHRTSARRGEATASMPHGGKLILYTDGLVERRDAVIDEGIARVSDEIARGGAATAAELAERLLEPILTEPRGDDACVLIAGFHPD